MVVIRDIVDFRTLSAESAFVDIRLETQFEGTLDFLDGDDTVIFQSGGGDLRSGTLRGGSGNDKITGVNAASIFGDDGNDTVVGSGDLYGGAGNDRLLSSGVWDYTVLDGQAGDDEVVGSSGFSETIIGGAGRDIMTGGGSTGSGGGGDTFIFKAGDLGRGYGTRDKITDFDVGEDHIDLSAFHGAAVTITHQNQGYRVKLDVDHDHRTDFMIHVQTAQGVLTMEDLLL